MTYTREKARLATTAIAAVLAISATPLVAQEVTPPDPATSTPTTTADPLSPEPTASEPSAPEATETAEPAAAPTPAAKSKPAATASKRTATKASAAPARTPAPAEPVSTDAAPPAPAAPTEMTPIVDAVPVAEPAPAPAPEPAATSMIDMDEALPIAGAGALALLGLGAGAAALRRRKRRREDALSEEQWQAEQVHDEPAVEPVRPVVAPAVAPALAAAPRHDPVPIDAPRTRLPEGFDLSRFGRHVQAAYRGPTADNPSLSLKYRLRKAAAMDQRERLNGTIPEQPAAPAAAPKTVTATTVKAQPARTKIAHGGDFLFGGSGTAGAVRPAYTKVN